MQRQSSPKPKAVLWVTALLLCLILLLNAATFLRTPPSFLAGENRMRATAPAFSWQALADGSYTRGLESWFSDRFAGRDNWLALHNALHAAMGQRDSGGVYLGKNDTLFLIPSPVNETALSANLAAMNAFAARHKDLRHTALIAPNAVCVWADRLPDHAPVPDQQAQLQQVADRLQGVTFANVTDALLAHKQEDLYYRTDHHWTTPAARIALEAAAPAMGLDRLVSEYDDYTVSQTFEGTLASKSGRHGTPDAIHILLPKTDVRYNVTDPNGEKATLFDRAKLDTKDQYAVFLGGNHPLVTIKTTAQTGRRLLLFKDSYANCFAPLLTPYYEEILLVDPRYYYDTADALVRQHGITDVLYLYNADTFFTDTTLADVLVAETVPE